MFYLLYLGSLGKFLCHFRLGLLPLNHFKLVSSPYFKILINISSFFCSSLWTSPGTYQTVVLQLHLPFNDSIKNATGQAEVGRPIQLSYNEKFPSKGHHATFVTSLRPLTAHLSSALPLKVTLTIFAPTYVPNGSRVQITLIVRDKPKISSGAVIGLKSFLFSVTNLALNQIDHDPPTCQNSFLCSDFVSQCQTKNDDENCEVSEEFNAQILVQDELTGMRSIHAQDHKVLSDLTVGNANNLMVNVTGDCCHPYVILNLTDVAGNSKLCKASVNTASSFLVPVNGLIYRLVSCLLLCLLLCIA